MTEEQQAEPGRRVKVVYCGGCNPHIDRTAVAAELPVGQKLCGHALAVDVRVTPAAEEDLHEVTRYRSPTVYHTWPQRAAVNP